MAREEISSAALFNSEMFPIFVFSLEILVILKKEGDILMSLYVCVCVYMSVFCERSGRNQYII